MAESRFGREVVVGTLVLIAGAIFVLGTMFLSGRSWRTSGGVVIRFKDAGDLKRATPVRVSGVPVGKVLDLELERPGSVLVTISLPDNVQPTKGSSAFIRTVGLAGDAALVFDPGTDPEPLGRDTVQGRDQVALTDMAGGLAASGDSLIRDARALVGPQRAEQIDRTLRKLDATLESTQKLMALYANPSSGPTAELQATLAEYRAVATRLDSTLASPALARALDKSDTLVSNLSAMSAQFRATGERLDSILAKVDRGEGTLGKLATDTALYGRFTDLSGSVDSLVRDLRKNPGKIGVTVKMF